MTEKLTELVERQENELLRYQADLDSINHKIQFMSKHGFNNELAHLQHTKNSMIDLFFEYKRATSELRGVLNAWNS